MLYKTLLVTLLSTASAAALPANNIERSTNPDFSSYAPVEVQCPKTNQWVRPAHGLSEAESAWVAGRKKKVLNGLSSYLKRLHLTDFDTDEYLSKLAKDPSKVPTIGLAFSGGGWSPAMTGTGALLAFDDRFEDSVQQRTGGILQSMTYLSGLSGGSWPVMGLSTYNFPTIPDMVGYWHVDESPFFANTTSAHRVPLKVAFEQLLPKFKAGYNISVIEMLGRAMAYEFAAGANGALESMVSDIASLSNFKDYEMPFPMWQAYAGAPWDVKYYGLAVPSYNNTIVEWNPFEFGAWGGPESFFPTKYLGTKMSDGKPVDDKCIVGYDRVSFLLGAAADAINFWQIEVDSNGTVGSWAKHKRSETVDWAPISFPAAVMSAMESGFLALNYTLPEAAFASVPNPFALSSDNTDYAPHGSTVTLIDESEAGQSLPLWSQIQPARNPEFIIAWDADQDAQPYHWNNGSNLYWTYSYATNNSVPFPIVPRPESFSNLKLNTGPHFFGCDAKLTNMNDLRSPIVAYMPNAPYSAYTNYTWTTSQFSNEQMAVILTNSFNYITAGNSTLDSEWPECLGCAAIDRSLSKLGMKRTKQCESCMTRYCWNGKEDNSDPGLLDITLVLNPSVSYAEWNKTVTADFWPELKGSKWTTDDN